jgi:hypothetical protein
MLGDMDGMLERQQWTVVPISTRSVIAASARLWDEPAVI